MKHFPIAAACLLAARLFTAHAASLPEATGSASEMRPLIERYAADRGLLLRYYSIDLSASRRDRMRKFDSEWLDRLPTLNFDAMGQDGKIDYILFRNYLDHDLRELDLHEKHQVEAAPLVPFTKTIVDLEESRRRMDPADPKNSARALSSLAKEAAALERATETALKSSPQDKTIANRAAGEVISLRSVLKRWFDFYNGYDPMFTWWAAESYKQADAALAKYATFLRVQVAGIHEPPLPLPGFPVPPVTRPDPSRMDSTDDIIGDPIGRDGLMSELASEMIPYTPEQLIAIANKEFAWCEEQMKQASNELGYGDDWKKALEHVKNMYVEPGKQPQLIRDLEREAEAFIDQHDLITIPPLARETWRMEMMTPERQLVNPFFTGGEVMSVSYPVESMTFEQKLMSMRGNNIPFSRATVFHELIPGHELQLFMAARHHPYRQIFNTPFLTEGWSLYWEMLMWDMHFQKTPEDRIGALFWRMHRCARIIFSLSFHLGKMTPQQAVDFLVDRVGHERDNAIGEVRRSLNGSYSPLYQAAYLLGGMQLYALHKELVDSGKMTNRQFHDAILKEGRMPVELIRASLTHQKLARDFGSNWLFYGPVIP